MSDKRHLQLRQALLDEITYRPDPARTHPPVDESVALPQQVRVAAEHANALVEGRLPPMAKAGDKSTTFEEIPPIRPDPNRTHLPIGDKVKLPRQVHLALEHAKNLVAGGQSGSVEVNTTSAKRKSALKSPYTDTQIMEALVWLETKADPSNPSSTIALELALEGALSIEARRRGARKLSVNVTQRLEALLQAYRKLPFDLQQHATGQETVKRLRESVCKNTKVKLSAYSEDMILKDIQQISSLLRLVRERIILPSGRPWSTPELKEQTRREMEAGRRVVTELVAHRMTILRFLRK